MALPPFDVLQRFAGEHGAYQRGRRPAEREGGVGKGWGGGDLCG